MFESLFSEITDNALPIPTITLATVEQTYTTPTIIESHTRHQTVIPIEQEHVPLTMLPEYPHLSFPFELDIFQKLALTGLHLDDNVLVSAHTSSGKTVVAEYAIALSFSMNQRVIYTSPIKALSNQKYRELSEKFGDVGLITGDTTLNPSANCLVMTTEILRNMLYKGSEIMKSVKWVIFDEVHYIKEKERGVVWEECIIMADQKVRMVFLSATVPNACEFAEWISEIRGSKVHVIYTEKRPTPLEHYLAIKGHGEHIKILYNQSSTNANNKKRKTTNIGDRNSKGTKDKHNKESVANLCHDMTEEQQTVTFFDKDAFAHAIKNLNGKTRTTEEDVTKALNTMIEKDLLPTIIFSFSRKECEKYALALTHDFLNGDEKEAVNLIFKNALMNLRKEDQTLTLITNLLPLLSRGIGIHHSGLLPILKEIVEILFQENLIKVLFATETFAIGLNMPARSVVFTNLSKFDGEERRILSSGEYIQMSGRAGRRGIDNKGVVVALLSDPIDIKKGKRLFSGLADKLTSAFRLSYNMILNLMNAEGIDTVQLLEKTFYHFQSKKLRDVIGDKIRQMDEKIDIIDKERQAIKKEYQESHGMFFLFDDGGSEIEINQKMAKDIKNQLRNINIGNLHPLQIHNLMVAFERIKKKRNKLVSELSIKLLETGRVVDLFIERNGSPCFINNAIVINANRNEVQVTASINGNIIKKRFESSAVDTIYDIRVKNLRSLEICLNKGIKKLSLEEIISMAQDNTGKSKKAKDPGADLRYSEILLLTDVSSMLGRVLNNYFCICLFCGSQTENTDCIANRCVDETEIEEKISQVSQSSRPQSLLRKVFLEERYKIEYDRFKGSLKEQNEIYHLDECKKMIKVLRRLEYSNDHGVLQKGRFACEISSGDELILTEMMFNGDFLSLPVEEVVPLLSCIIYPDWDNDSSLTDKNKENYALLERTVMKISEVMQSCGIDVDYKTTMKKYSYEMMDVVELWIKGCSFAEICGKSKIFEGTIIRCFRRLEEMLKQMAAAARVIGNTELENLFADGIVKIKKDIVFASSLYIAN